MAGGAGKVCPKCDYVRTGEEGTPDYECPKCGIVYAKVEAAMAREQAANIAPDGDASIWQPSQHATEVDDEEFAEPKIFARKGRIGRLRYIAYSVGVYFVMLPLFGIAVALMSMGEGGMIGGSIVMMITYIAVAVFFIMWTVRRINDFNMNGWFVLLFMFVGFILWFIPGTKGSNNYGPPPTPNTTGVKVLSIGVCLLIP